MKQRIIFVCQTCQDFNKQNLGTQGFEIRETEFFSFTEAYEHLVNGNERHLHYIEAFTEEEER